MNLSLHHSTAKLVILQTIVAVVYMAARNINTSDSTNTSMFDAYHPLHLFQSFGAFFSCILIISSINAFSMYFFLLFVGTKRVVFIRTPDSIIFCLASNVMDDRSLINDNLSKSTHRRSPEKHHPRFNPIYASPDLRAWKNGDPHEADTPVSIFLPKSPSYSACSTLEDSTFFAFSIADESLHRVCLDLNTPDSFVSHDKTLHSVGMERPHDYNASDVVKCENSPSKIVPTKDVSQRRGTPYSKKNIYTRTHVRRKIPTNKDKQNISGA